MVAKVARGSALEAGVVRREGVVVGTTFVGGEGAGAAARRRRRVLVCGRRDGGNYETGLFEVCGDGGPSVVECIFRF